MAIVVERAMLGYPLPFKRQRNLETISTLPTCGINILVHDWGYILASLS